MCNEQVSTKECAAQLGMFEFLIILSLIFVIKQKKMYVLYVPNTMS